MTRIYLLLGQFVAIRAIRVSPFSFQSNMIMPQENHRTGDIDRGISPRDQPDDHGCRKIMDHRPPEEKENQNNHHHRPGGEDRPPKGLVYADIENGFEALLSHLLDILPDPVKDDDCIVDRESDDRQNDGEKR